MNPCIHCIGCSRNKSRPLRSLPPHTFKHTCPASCGNSLLSSGAAPASCQQEHRAKVRCLTTCCWTEDARTNSSYLSPSLCCMLQQSQDRVAALIACEKHSLKRDNHVGCAHVPESDGQRTNVTMCSTTCRMWSYHLLPASCCFASSMLWIQVLRTDRTLGRGRESRERKKLRRGPLVALCCAKALVFCVRRSMDGLVISRTFQLGLLYLTREICTITFTTFCFCRCLHAAGALDLYYCEKTGLDPSELFTSERVSSVLFEFSIEAHPVGANARCCPCQRFEGNEHAHVAVRSHFSRNDYFVADHLQRDRGALCRSATINFSHTICAVDCIPIPCLALPFELSAASLKPDVEDFKATFASRSASS